MLKNSFTKLKLFQKIELYLLVIMFFGFGYYLLKFIPISQSNITKNPSSNQNIILKINQLKENIIKKPKNSFVELLEIIASKNNISIKSIQLNKNKITLHTIGGYQNSIYFLTYLQNHLQIDSFQLEYKKARLMVDIVIDIKYLFDKNIEYNSIENIPNPFINTKIRSYKNKDNLVVTAIVSNMVMINNKWYKVGDNIKANKIISIGLNSIKIKNSKTNKIAIVKVYHE